MKLQRNLRSTGTIIAVVVIGLLSACASQKTERISNVKRAGFLSDYSVLKKGGEGQATLVYWNPRADFKKYDKVLIEPVTIWLAPGSKLHKISPAQRKELANAFYAEIRKALSKDYRFVTKPQPGTMRIRVALTDADKSSQALDTISNIVPQAFIASSLVSLATEKATSVGEASAEGEVRDAMSGELLAAGVDRRAGVKYYGRMVAKWTDAKRAFKAWSEQFANNLRKRRGR